MVKVVGARLYLRDWMVLVGRREEMSTKLWATKARHPPREHLKLFLSSRDEGMYLKLKKYTFICAKH